LKKKGKKQQSNSLGLQALSQHQSDYINSIDNNVVSVGLGFAGSGKTYIASTMAAQFRIDNKDSRIVLCRPNVSDSKSIGFLPGEEMDKMAPWIVPYTDILRKHLSGTFEKQLGEGTIQVVPFEFIQGRTFDNSFVILDEAQHTTKKEMETFLKRIGKNSKVVVCGDIQQARLGNSSGLKLLIDMHGDTTLPEVSQNIGVTVFDNPDDIVRSEFCREITKAFDRYYAMGGG
jgi:phosphate starvation-inducible PhoH-like protein|tara:strand:- start:2407 stop:3099 length:693 start_codon:yes stop_codon:yes gene_type:complete